VATWPWLYNKENTRNLPNDSSQTLLRILLRRADFPA
jgi:hypothetical protein